MKINDAVTALAALAQESRLRVVRMLVRAGEDGLPAGAIAGKLDIPAATLSFHLKELSRSGLVRSCRHGRSIHYAIRVEGMRSLLAFLTRDCCQGRPELCAGGSIAWMKGVSGKR